MKKIIFMFLIASNLCNAQVANNCATPNTLTKTDSNGNLVCSSITDNGTVLIGSYANPKSFYRYDNEFLIQPLNSTNNIFSWFINDNKPSASALWMIGSTMSTGGYGASNGFSFMEGDGNYQTRFFIQDGTGNVGIGTTIIPTNYKLAVAGKIIAEELKVQLQTAWPDYVFANDYKLPTLQEVEKQIKENGHLKDIPSAQEVKENGIQVGDMARIQQQKIEELTLYIIELNKKLEAQDKKLENLETKMNNNLITK